MSIASSLVEKSRRARRHTLLMADVSAFLSHRTFHKQYQECDRKGQHGDHPKDVEIGKRRRLLLTHIFELLPSQLLQRNRIGGLL